MIELQRTTLETSRELLSRSLSIQQRTLVRSWRAFAAPMTDVELERESAEERRATTTQSRDHRVTHRTVDVTAEGDAVEPVDERRTTTARVPTTPRDDGRDRDIGRSESGGSATDGTATGTVGVEEDAEPSTEMFEDAAESTDEDADSAQ